MRTTEAEKIISGFHEVWETQNHLFTPVSTSAMNALENGMIERKEQSDDVLADFLDNWLSDYEEITKAVEQAMEKQSRLGVLYHSHYATSKT